MRLPDFSVSNFHLSLDTTFRRMLNTATLVLLVPLILFPHRVYVSSLTLLGQIQHLLLFDPLNDLFLCSLTLLSHLYVLYPDAVHHFLVLGLVLLAVSDVEVPNDKCKLIIIVDLCLLDVFFLLIWTVL
jgi:hypothetical protein